MEEKLYTPAEVAARYAVKEQTVWGWIRTGRMSALNVGGRNFGCRYLIRTEDLAAFDDRCDTGRRSHE